VRYSKQKRGLRQLHDTLTNAKVSGGREEIHVDSRHPMKDSGRDTSVPEGEREGVKKEKKKKSEEKKGKK